MIGQQTHHKGDEIEDRRHDNEDESIEKPADKWSNHRRACPQIHQALDGGPTNHRFRAHKNDGRAERQCKPFGIDERVHRRAEVGEEPAKCRENLFALPAIARHRDTHAMDESLSGMGSVLWRLLGSPLIACGSTLSGESSHQAIGEQTYRVTFVERPHGHRSCRGDRQFRDDRVEAHPRFGIGVDIQENKEAILTTGLIDLAAQSSCARGRFPMDAARVVAWGVIAYSRDAQRIFKEATWRGTLAKWMPRGQAKGLDRRDQWVDQERFTRSHPFFAYKPAKWVTAAHGCWAKGIDPASAAAEPVAPRHTLERPER